MSFILKNNIKRLPINDNYKKNSIPKNKNGLFNINTLSKKQKTYSETISNVRSNTVPTLCDKDIYKMNYNMQTIKKGSLHYSKIPIRAVTISQASESPTST